MHKALFFIALSILSVFGSASTAQQSTTPLRQMAAENDARVWRAVGRLDASGSGFCTGTLIAPDLVLTAAHCVYSKRSGVLLEPDDLTFKAGLRNGRIAAAREVAQIEAHPNYDPKSPLTAQNIRHDVALLRLAVPIPTNQLDPFIVQDSTVSGGAVSIVSYGLNREDSPSRQDVCQVKQIQQEIVFMDCNVTFGSSGAPVFSHKNGRGQIVSVISGMANINGRMMALGMTLPDIVADLRHRMWAHKKSPVARINRMAIGAENAVGGAKFVRP